MKFRKTINLILTLFVALSIGLVLFSCDDTTSPSNKAPNSPSSPNPADNAVNVSITPTLSWECSDADNDPLTYDIYFRISTDSLESISTDQTAKNFTIATDLEFETIYYWQVTAKDDHEHQTAGEIWMFTTAANPNQPPNAPSSPVPADSSEGASVTPILSWSCSDPENDSLTYDVYFGSVSKALELVSQDQSDTTYVTNLLEYETSYSWKIVARDDHDNQTEGTIWNFTTEEENSFVQIEWCEVPAGEYTSGPNDSIKTIDYDYDIMKYEVTNYQYVEFLNDLLDNGEIYFDYGDYGSYSAFGFFDGDHPYYTPDYYEYIRWLHDGRNIQWNGSEFIIPEGKENHPVGNITYLGALLFAEHYGWKLPTKDEWEKASRGNTGYGYSWGDEIDGSRANYYNSGDPFEDEEISTTPVGYYNGENHDGFQTTDSPSPYGAYDMSGNSWEYVGTWNSIVDNCFIYGCSYFDYPPYFYVWRYAEPDGSLGANNIGFRCARDE